jgi:beta-galactosidase
VLDQIAPLAYENGGPIVALQVENEYGSYGQDLAYLEFLRERFLEAGLGQMVLFASNGAGLWMLQGGALNSLLRTINFGAGADVNEQVAVLRQVMPTGPLFVSEFWTGWFDHWGEQHHTVPPQTDVQGMQAVLALNGSINLYMARPSRPSPAAQTPLLTFPFPGTRRHQLGLHERSELGRRLLLRGVPAGNYQL